MLADRVRMGSVRYKNDKEFIDVYGFGRLVQPPSGKTDSVWTENILSLDTELPLIYFSTLEYHVVNISNVLLASNIRLVHTNNIERLEDDYKFYSSREPIVRSKVIDVDDKDKSYIDDREYVFDTLPHIRSGTYYKTIEEVPRQALGYYFQMTSDLIADAEIKGVVTIREGSSVGDIIYRDGFHLFFERSNCYLTTCMVGYYGKKDDGVELTAMRKLREKYKYKHSTTLAEYKRVSPHIIQGIEQSGNRGYWYNEIKKVVDKIVIWVSNEEWEKAEVAYLDLYYKLREKFYSEGD